MASASSAQQGLFSTGPAPMEIRQISSPQTVFRGDSSFVLYEMMIDNPTGTTFVVERLEISTAEGGLVATYEGDGWNEIVRPVPGESYVSEDDHSGGLAMSGGGRHLLYLWLGFEGRTVPEALSHAFVATWSYEDRTVRHVQAGPLLPVDRDPVVIDAPVRGGMWLVGNGYSSTADHRRFYTVDGRIAIPQRFGADFVKLAADGLNATDGELSNEIFHAFGEPMYAVADGTVVAIHDGLPDNQAGTTPSDLAWDDFPGNHVILRLDDGVYAAYVHLRASSIAVREGQQVPSGTLIGEIGNSGNTSAPHMHFHLMDAPHVNSSDGVPFVFRSFEVIAEDYRFQESMRPLPLTGRTLRESVPGLRWVIRFPDR